MRRYGWQVGEGWGADEEFGDAVLACMEKFFGSRVLMVDGEQVAVEHGKQWHLIADNGGELSVWKINTPWGGDCFHAPCYSTNVTSTPGEAFRVVPAGVLAARIYRAMDGKPWHEVGADNPHYRELRDLLSEVAA